MQLEAHRAHLIVDMWCVLHRTVCPGRKTYRTKAHLDLGAGGRGRPPGKLAVVGSVVLQRACYMWSEGRCPGQRDTMNKHLKTQRAKRPSIAGHQRCLEYRARGKGGAQIESVEVNWNMAS